MKAVTSSHPPAPLWDVVQARLDSDLPDWREQIDYFGQVAAVERRRKGERWSDDQVFESLVRAILSNATDWSKIESVLPELRSLFSDFSLVAYTRVPDETIRSQFVSWFTDRRAGSMTLKASLLRLKMAAEELLERTKTPGSADSYFHLRDGSCSNGWGLRRDGAALSPRGGSSIAGTS